MDKGKGYYYRMCADCDCLYHCYGRETGNEIANSKDKNIPDMYLMPGRCNSFYPDPAQT